MPLTLGPGDFVAIGLEPCDYRRQSCQELVAAPLEEAIDYPAGFEEGRLLGFMGSLRPFDTRLALGDEVGQPRGVFSALDRIRNPGAAQFEIAETGEKLGIVRHQSNSEPRDRVDRLRRLIVPGPVRRDDAKG